MKAIFGELLPEFFCNLVIPIACDEVGVAAVGNPMKHKVFGRGFGNKLFVSE